MTSLFNNNSSATAKAIRTHKLFLIAPGNTTSFGTSFGEGICYWKFSTIAIEVWKAF
jgi:hypothetical protein